jgi:hypothetical protein
MRKLLGTTLLLAFLVAVGAGAEGQPAVAEPGPYQEAKLRFTTLRPDKPSGLIFAVDYVNPSDPDAKPPPVRRIVQRLAPGSRIDTSAPAACTASDLDLMLMGPSVCPADSAVGRGFVTVDTGFPGPQRILHADITFLNDEGELIIFSRERSTGLAVITRARIEGRTVITDSPLLPGTPPDFGAVDTARAKLSAISAEGRAYITTPPRCPRNGHWTNRVTFTYSNGTTQTVASRSPCREASSG